MAEGDYIMSKVVGDAPAFACGPCAQTLCSENSTLTVVISGLDGCNCVSQGGSPERFLKTVITGINGTHTVTHNGFWWQVITGHLVADYFYGAESTCEGEGGIGEHFSVDLRVLVQCDANGTYVIVQHQTIGDFVCFLSASAPLGTALANVQDCATFGDYGHNGTATVSE